MRPGFALLVFCAATAFGPAQGTITSISPSAVPMNAPAFTLTVQGSGFAAQNLVRWNASTLPTNFVSSTQLTAAVPASFLTSTGTFSIRVRENVFSVNFSNTVLFTVGNPVPVLTSISPSSVNAGGGAFNIIATGSGFVSSSLGRLNGINLPTTILSGTSLQATVSAALIASGGSKSFTVESPAPLGGTSAVRILTVINPVPTLTSLSQSSALALSTPFSFGAFGTNFNAQSQIRVDGHAITTVLTSTTIISGPLSAAHLASPGTLSISVSNPTPGGGTTAPLSFIVNAAPPSVSGVSPPAITAGSGNTTISVSGSDFFASSVVRWNGSSLATTFVNNTSLQATVGTALLSVAGGASVTVSTPAPGGGTSNVVPVTVQNPLPVATSLVPAEINAQSASFFLDVDGSGFVNGSQISFNGTLMSTSFIAATRVRALIAPASIPVPGPVPVTVVSPLPGGGTSQALTFTIGNPLPVLTAVSPNTVVRDGPAFTLTATGTRFVSSSTITWNTLALSTTFVSDTQVTAVVPALLLLNVLGSASVRVVNPPPVGGTSGALSVAIVNPVASITSTSPAALLATNTNTPLTIIGSGFVASSFVLLNAAPLAATVVSSTQIQTTVPATLLAAPGAVGVEVVNPPPGGGSNSALLIAVLNPAPAIASTLPTSIPVGLPNPILTLFGSGFNAATTVLVDGFPAAVSVVNDSQVDVVIPTLVAAVTRALRVQATNPAPGGGASAEITVLVDGPTILSFAPTAIPAGSPAPVIVDVFGSGFAAGHQVRANGVPVPTTFIDSSRLQAVLAPSLPEVQIPGGVIFTVTAGTTASSNARDLPVGIPVAPINRGTVSLSPVPPAPGAAFGIRVETSIHTVPVSLIADIAQPGPVSVSAGPGSTLMLGVLLGIPIPLADGLGVFGPPDGSILRDGVLQVNGPGVPYGVFEMPFFIAPNPAAGIIVALQAAYLDVTSPIGIGLTQALYPITL